MHGSMRWMAVAVLVLAGGSMGCVGIVFPTDYLSVQNDGAHARVDGELLAKLQERVVTRQEVRAVVGPRDVELARGRVWVYSWTVRRELVLAWAFASMHGGGANKCVFDSERYHYLLLEFDERDVLSRKAVRRGGFINGMARGFDDAMRE